MGCGNIQGQINEPSTPLPTKTSSTTPATLIISQPSSYIDPSQIALHVQDGSSPEVVISIIKSNNISRDSGVKATSDNNEGGVALADHEKKQDNNIIDQIDIMSYRGSIQSKGKNYVITQQEVRVSFMVQSDKTKFMNEDTNGNAEKDNIKKPRSCVLYQTRFQSTRIDSTD